MKLSTGRLLDLIGNGAVALLVAMDHGRAAGLLAFYVLIILDGIFLAIQDAK